MYSLYGPNNKTLVAATDAALHQLVETAGQPKSGPMVERLRSVPAGSDIYVALDLAMIRPFLQMYLMQAPPKQAAEAKKLSEMLNLISGIDLTLNVSSSNTSSLVVRCKDETAAQKMEAAIQEVLQKQAQQPGADNPIVQAGARYWERILPIQPQREGTNITCFRLDGTNPSQQQFASFIVSGIGLMMAVAPKAVQQAAQMQQAAAAGNPGAPPGFPAAPPSPEPGQRP
jgi:hypothetical protein